MHIRIYKTIDAMQSAQFKNPNVYKDILRIVEADTRAVDGGPDAELEPGVKECEAQEQHVLRHEQPPGVGQGLHRRLRGRPVVGGPDGWPQDEQQPRPQGRHAQQHDTHQVPRVLVNVIWKC